MITLSEAETARLATHELAYEAVRKAFLAAVAPESVSFPILHGHGSDPANRFTVKSSACEALAGLKVGSYWPGNADKGLARHNSAILLIDQSCGKVCAVVEAGTLNAYRTAAADAVAADRLAQPDASVLTVFGTGHQAAYEVAALARIRALERILVVGRSAEKAASFAAKLQASGLPVEPSDAQSACRAADIIVTATPATAPLLEAAWVQPGTHIASMGSDAPGKQELPPALYDRASLFCDLPEQSRISGEFQHAPDAADLTAIGSVLAGRDPGRVAADQVTIFDSSGLSLQDLFIARAALDAHGVRF